MYPPIVSSLAHRLQCCPELQTVRQPPAYKKRMAIRPHVILHLQAQNLPTSNHPQRNPILLLPIMLRTTFTKTASLRPLRAAFTTTARAMGEGDTGAPPKLGGAG